MPPRMAHQSPANIDMWADWMIGTRRHDASVAEKSTFPAFNCPAAETMLTVCHCIAVKLCVAFLPADRSSVVMHHRRVSVHGGKRVAVSILPTAKAHARRGDDHGDIIHSLGSKGGWRNSRLMACPRAKRRGAGCYARAPSRPPSQRGYGGRLGPSGNAPSRTIPASRRSLARGSRRRCKQIGQQHQRPTFHNARYPAFDCSRNIEMTPLCKIEVTLPRVLGSREVRRGGGVDEQAGVQPA